MTLKLFTLCKNFQADQWSKKQVRKWRKDKMIKSQFHVFFLELISTLPFCSVSSFASVTSHAIKLKSSFGVRWDACSHDIVTSSWFESFDKHFNLLLNSLAAVNIDLISLDSFLICESKAQHWLSLSIDHLILSNFALDSKNNNNSS